MGRLGNRVEEADFRYFKEVSCVRVSLLWVIVEEIIGYGVLNGVGNISDIGWSCVYIGMEFKFYYYDCYYSIIIEM